jgi:tRNA (cmo5U34)-methyltransferase
MPTLEFVHFGLTAKYQLTTAVARLRERGDREAVGEGLGDFARRKQPLTPGFAVPSPLGEGRYPLRPRCESKCRNSTATVMNESSANVNCWSSAEHALDYLSRIDTIPHRTEGEAVLLDSVPRDVSRILDLGSGDGRLLRLLKVERPQARAVALDFSPVMLSALNKTFAGDPTVTIVEHNFDSFLPGLGQFDAVVSSFAIHHLADTRKRSLYEEIFRLLLPHGVFLNLEHVASPTKALHELFLEKLGIGPEEEDPSNKLLDVETQLGWMRRIGFVDVDCYWKWLELALLGGKKSP